MSIEAAVIECWAAYTPLSSRVPKTKVWKGTVPQRKEDGNLLEGAYVALKVEEPETQRTSSNMITSAQLTLEVHAESESEAEDIANEAKEFFDGKERNWSRGRILDMKWDGTTRVDEDGEWHLAVVFRTMVLEARSSTN